jgi:hypothetical protein
MIISRRLASLCATKALLNSYGFDVATVTTEAAAVAVVRSGFCRAAIVCFHSFTAAERDHIAATLRDSNPMLPVVARCSGCSNCDEQAGLPCNLPDDQWLGTIIIAMRS